MSFGPLLPWPVLVVAAGVTIALAWRQLRQRHRARAPVLRLTAIVALTLVAALDPAIDGGSVAALRSDADVLFVVDTTGSMAAEDHDGDTPRLDAVRDDLRELIAEFPGAHFALITFDSKARIVVPWTTDVAAIDTSVSLLRQERTIYARGSRLDLPVDAMARVLPRTEDGSRYGVVFFVSDGEQTAEAEPPDFRSLAPSVSAGAVLGYGTDEGGPMRIYTGRDGTLDQFIADADGEEAISRIDEGALRGIAEDLGIGYEHRTTAGGIDELAAGIADGARRERAGSRDGDRRLYWIPAFGIVALALWHGATTAFEVAAAHRATGTRRGRRELAR